MFLQNGNVYQTLSNGSKKIICSSELIGRFYSLLDFKNVPKQRFKPEKDYSLEIIFAYKKYKTFTKAAESLNMSRTTFTRKYKEMVNEK